MENNKVILGVIALVVILGAGYMLMASPAKEDAKKTTTNTEIVTQKKEEVQKIEEKDATKKEEKTIVDIAVGNKDFETLVTAVKKAGLVETLSGEGPFTVFAPTDDAFAKIPEETLNAILADKEKLTSILTYHVVAGKVMAKDVVKLTSATTLQGQDLTVKVNADGTVMINNAKVVMTDIEASNGVIHVIDTVLLPQ